MTDLTDSNFAAALNEQVGNEFAAHQQYLAIAAYYDAETLPRLAAFFYHQAVEERNHAMMLTQYLLDADLAVVVPGVAAPESGFPDIVAPVELALAQEKRVTAQISALAAKARDGGDYQGEQFMGWFIKEQVEEVSTMSDLLRVVERGRENPMMIEEYLAREGFGEGGADPTAPAAAGGAL
ncbi:MAG: ferritin [Solirubrobacterales bacterium]